MKAKDGSNHGTLPLLTTLIKTHHDTPVFRIPLCRSLAREMLLLSRASLRRLRIRMIRPSSRQGPGGGRGRPRTPMAVATTGRGVGGGTNSPPLDTTCLSGDTWGLHS